MADAEQGEVEQGVLPSGQHRGKTVDAVWAEDPQYVWFLSQRGLTHVQLLRYDTRIVFNSFWVGEQFRLKSRASEKELSGDTDRFYLVVPRAPQKVVHIQNLRTNTQTSYSCRTSGTSDNGTGVRTGPAWGPALMPREKTLLHVEELVVQRKQNKPPA
jgi:hypothetical protein